MLSSPRTTTMGSPAMVQVTYEPGSRSCSTRAATCHDLENTVSRSSFARSAFTYHELGMVDASSSGAFGSYLWMIWRIFISSALYDCAFPYRICSRGLQRVRRIFDERGLKPATTCWIAKAESIQVTTSPSSAAD